METIKLKGVISEILEQQEGVSLAGNKWQKQDFILVNENKFNNKIAITIFKEITPQQSTFFEIGRRVEVEVVVYSKEYNGKYFTNIQFLNIK